MLNLKDNLKDNSCSVGNWYTYRAIHMNILKVPVELLKGVEQAAKDEKKSLFSISCQYLVHY
jgi:hypothetical protein